MTSTERKAIDLTLIEPEFGKACEYCRDGQTDDPAAWAGLSAHGGPRCPGFAYVCDRHKRFVEERWAVDLSDPNFRCFRCGPVLGQVSDVIRWIKL
jgi:hypothetical protein